MRKSATRAFALCAALGVGAGALASCGEDEVDAEISPVADPPTLVELEGPPPEPSHDGSVVMVGGLPVEVVTRASGEVEAYVLGDGPPLPQMEMTIEVPVEGRASGRPVRMVYDPSEERFTGRVRRLEIVEGPIDVQIVVGGASYAGHVDVIVVLPSVVVVEERPAVQIRRVKHRRKHKHRRRGHGRGGRHGGVDIRIH